MIALMLQDAMADRLRVLFDGYKLPCKSGLWRPVRVFTQFLPLPAAVQSEGAEGPLVFNDGLSYGEADLEGNFPCILVKVDDGMDREENGPDACRVSLRLLVGVYDPEEDCQGYRDALNIVESVRQDLLTHRYLAKKYRLEMPLKWYIFEEQPWPVFFACLETAWETGRPTEQIERKEGDWRDGDYPWHKEERDPHGS